MATRLFLREQEASTLKVCSDLVSLRTERRVQFVDLTELVAERVRRSGVVQGLVCLQTKHTTTAVLVNEGEPLLLDDLEKLLQRLAPRDGRYRHNDLWLRPNLPPEESENGDAHCKAVLLGTSATLGIVDGQTQLGEWQRLFLVELDGPRRRTVCVVVMGATR